MKSKTILFFFIFAHLQTISQEADQSPLKWRRWSVGIGFSGDISYRFLVETDLPTSGGSFVPQDLIEARNEMELPTLGFTSGILTEYWLNKRFSLECAVYYGERGYGTENVSMTDETGTRVGFASSKTYYHFLDIPCRINIMSKLTERWFLSTGIGCSANFLLERGFKAHLEWANGRVEDYVDIYESGYDTFNLSSIVAISAGYKWSDRSVVKAGPIFRYSLFRPTETPITEHLYQLGIQCCYVLSL